MLTLNPKSGAWQDSWFEHLPELLQEGDVLVLNDSRVIPARLFGVRPATTGKVEVLLTEQVSDWEWRGGLRPARRRAGGGGVGFAGPGGQDGGGSGAGLGGAGRGGALTRHGRGRRRVRGTSPSLHTGTGFLCPA